MNNYYTKSEIKGNKYVITQVREEVLHDVKIENVTGEAVLTHIGAYKRIKFIFADIIWISESGNKIALNEDKTLCINMDDLSFDKDIEFNWNNYISLRGSNKYWINAEHEHSFYSQLQRDREKSGFGM